MPLSAPTLKVNAPVEKFPVGRGFYQLEEDELYIPVEYPGEKGRFFSYLDSETVSMQIDRDGRLIFIEVVLPRRRWQAKGSFVPPESVEPADVRFLDFRDSLKRPAIYCDKSRHDIMIRFLKGPADQNLKIARNVIVQVDAQSRLVALWVFGITDDIAGKEIATWRKEFHKTETESVTA